MLPRYLTGWLGPVGRLLGVLRAEFVSAREEARNEAHLATTADRPFMGCQPCVPNHPGPLGPRLDNPEPKPHPRARE